jgi:hypothetical protein
MQLTQEQKYYIISTVENIPLFERCGVQEKLEIPFSSQQVKSWEIAEKCYTSYVWDCITLEAKNQLTQRLGLNFPELYHDILVTL